MVTDTPTSTHRLNRKNPTYNKTKQAGRRWLNPGPLEVVTVVLVGGLFVTGVVLTELFVGLQTVLNKTNPPNTHTSHCPSDNETSIGETGCYTLAEIADELGIDLNIL